MSGDTHFSFDRSVPLPFLYLLTKNKKTKKQKLYIGRDSDKAWETGLELAYILISIHRGAKSKSSKSIANFLESLQSSLETSNLLHEGEQTNKIKKIVNSFLWLFFFWLSLRNSCRTFWLQNKEQHRTAFEYFQCSKERGPPDEVCLLYHNDTYCSSYKNNHFVFQLFCWNSFAKEKLKRTQKRHEFQQLNIYLKKKQCMISSVKWFSTEII